MARKICILNTGGTVGMDRGTRGYLPRPGFLGEQLSRIEELSWGGMPEFELIEFDPVLDSSNMTPDTWLKIADTIYRHHDTFDGFVVIHGTDTLAHTASAMPFMLPGLRKTVILTGSQIPLVEIRSDARGNLITSMLLAADYQIPEVCVYFSHRLLRGCRTTKVSASSFGAFDSPNFPPLATVGTRISILTHQIRQPEPTSELALLEIKPQAVGTFRLFPGVSHQVLENVLRQPLVALILETYGVGNGPSNDRGLMQVLKDATDRGTVVVSCTQCVHGYVSQTRYDAGTAFREAGVVAGGDMTVEAALAKLQYLFTHYEDRDQIRELVSQDLVGELTPEEHAPLSVP